MFLGIDFSSDTATKPSAAMKKAMLEAELGDEQKDEDPTTRELEKLTAKILGMADAIFLPSATMSNQVALMLSAKPGEEIFAAENCHIFLAESGAPAILARVMCKPIRTENGIFTPDDLLAVAQQSASTHRPKASIVSIENTTNLGGGVPWTQNQLQEIIACADQLSLRKHMDGARLFNASTATGTPPANMVRGFDTVTICLSKGLGCPVGAVLVFRDAADRKEAKHYKHLLGGAMRQSGILSAAGIYALMHNISRLQEDHANTKLLASELAECDQSIRIVNNPPQTNILVFDWIDSKKSHQDFHQSCIEMGIRFSHLSGNRYRAVLHLDISREQVLEAANIIREICLTPTIRARL